MSRLSQTTRNAVKQGAKFPGVITDVLGNRASVKLSTNGALYQGLDVVGGPVYAGQSVIVDFTGMPPTIIAPSLSQDSLNTRIEDIEAQLDTSDPPSETGATTQEIISEILVFDGPPPTIGMPQLEPLYRFSATSAGLIDAVEACNVNGSIYLPPCDITMEYQISIFKLAQVGSSGSSFVGNGVSIIGYSRDKTILRDVGFLIQGSVYFRDLTLSVINTGYLPIFSLTYSTLFLDNILIYCSDATPAYADIIYIDYPSSIVAQKCTFESNGVGVRNILDGSNLYFRSSAGDDFVGFNGSFEESWETIGGLIDINSSQQSLVFSGFTENDVSNFGKVGAWCAFRLPIVYIGDNGYIDLSVTLSGGNSTGVSDFKIYLDDFRDSVNYGGFSTEPIWLDRVLLPAFVNGVPTSGSDFSFSSGDTLTYRIDYLDFLGIGDNYNNTFYFVSRLCFWWDYTHPAIAYTVNASTIKVYGNNGELIPYPESIYRFVECTFACDLYDIYSPNDGVAIFDRCTLGPNIDCDTIFLLSPGQTPVFFGNNEPKATWPGMWWIKE